MRTVGSASSKLSDVEETEMLELVMHVGGEDMDLLGDNATDLLMDETYMSYLQEIRETKDSDVVKPLGHIHHIDRANWLRAAVLGANDGLVSVAALTMGMVGVMEDNKELVLATAGAALLAGALSMATGEYVSVSAQRELEMADVEKERQEQQKGPKARVHELDELVHIYIERGLSPPLARQVAVQLSRHDVVRTHARDELGIDIDDFVDPWQAAAASAVAFSLGAVVPILALLIPASSPLQRDILVCGAVTVALIVNGSIGAYAGGAPIFQGIVRVLLGGWLSMGVTYGAGKMYGPQDTDVDV